MNIVEERTLDERISALEKLLPRMHDKINVLCDELGLTPPENMGDGAIDEPVLVDDTPIDTSLDTAFTTSLIDTFLVQSLLILSDIEIAPGNFEETASKAAKLVITGCLTAPIQADAADAINTKESAANFREKSGKVADALEKTLRAAMNALKLAGGAAAAAKQFKAASPHIDMAVKCFLDAQRKLGKYRTDLKKTIDTPAKRTPLKNLLKEVAAKIQQGLTQVKTALEKIT